MAVKLQQGLIFKGCWLRPSAECAGALPEGWGVGGRFSSCLPGRMLWYTVSVICFPRVSMDTAVLMLCREETWVSFLGMMHVGEVQVYIYCLSAWKFWGSLSSSQILNLWISFHNIWRQKRTDSWCSEPKSLLTDGTEARIVPCVAVWKVHIELSKILRASHHCHFSIYIMLACKIRKWV